MRRGVFPSAIIDRLKSHHREGICFVRGERFRALIVSYADRSSQYWIADCGVVCLRPVLEIGVNLSLVGVGLLAKDARS